MSSEWGNENFDVVGRYLKEESEHIPCSASLLSKERVENGVAPDQVVEAHLARFRRIADTLTHAELAPQTYKSFDPLFEMMAVYGVTLKEHMKLREELKKALASQAGFKRLKFFIDEIEFVTQRLGSLNDELDRRLVELSSLHQVSGATSSALELDTLLQAIPVLLGEVVEYHSCSVMVLDEANRLELRINVRKDSRPVDERHLRLHAIAGEWAMRQGEACLVSDVHNDQRFKASDVQICSLLAVPMIVKQVKGAIVLDDIRADAFTDATSCYLTVVANEAGVAINNT